MATKPTIKVGDIFITNEGCKVKVVEYFNVHKLLIEFQDDNQYKVFVTGRNLRVGEVKNPYYPSVYKVGYIGVGEYRAYINGKMSPVYRIWKAMLQRCYDLKFQESNQTYTGCTVCNEWHNFQVFAEWYTSQNNYNNGYHLDKDLLIDGNKVYSPQACTLVPQELNNLLWRSEKYCGDYPLGVSLDKRNGMFKAEMRFNNNRRFLGYFDKPEQASQAYQKAKKEYVKQKALEWQNRIDERLFNALMAKAA